MKFTIDKKLANGLGRAGVIETVHGKIMTPAFIPVGTKATVKALLPETVSDFVMADAILANTYHLYLEPGTEILKKSGGLGKFMNWKGPTFTDSGGFQAFSLGSKNGDRASKIAKEDFGQISTNKENKMADSTNILERSDDSIEKGIEDSMAKIDDDGVTFRSIIDGSKHRFTPEKAIEIQNDIGADIIFVLDECISPEAPIEKQKMALNRTHEWAKRCLNRHKELNVDGSQALFGIVQGGRYEELRRESARTVGAMDFDGFGIGGSFDKRDIGTAVKWVCSELPENKPRHLLGIGEPEDLILGIENGIDTFDCVAPTRIARNGSAYSSHGRLNLTNAKFFNDFGPIDPKCSCYVCKNYSLAYISHLLRAKEMLASTLISIHNLYYIVNLVKQAREAILNDRWEEFKKRSMVGNSR